MKLPSYVSVGSMKYKVVDMSQDMHEVSGAHGLCDTTQLTIHINPNQSDKKRWSTLWHEVLHAQFEESALLKDKDDEEIIVSHLERIQCLVFRDNPTFIRNLTKVLRG